jgi:hypothetical protein
MSGVEQIKAAAAQLAPDEQIEIFRWWVETLAFKQSQRAALKRELATGLDDLNNGRHKTYDESNVMLLAEEIRRYGWERPDSKIGT